MTGRGNPNEGGNFYGVGISIEATRRIVLATGAVLKDGVEDKGLRAALNRLVSEVTVLSLSRDPRGGRRDLKQLRRAFETYQKLADTLPAHDLFPPKPPSNWRAAVTLWVKNTEADLKAMKGQSRANAMSKFYPRLIGLFAAAFEAEIKVSHDGSSNSAPLVKFAEAVIIAARESVDVAALAGQARANADGLTKPWIVPERDAIRVGLGKALRSMPDCGPGPLGARGYEGPLQPVWESHHLLFAELLGLAQKG